MNGNEKDLFTSIKVEAVLFSTALKFSCLDIFEEFYLNLTFKSELLIKSQLTSKFNKMPIEDFSQDSLNSFHN